MKIDKIVLKNFQAHKDSTIYPKEGLNAFIGESGKGKSSIHRSLTWLIDNKVAGDRPNQNIHNHDIVSKTKSGNTKFLGNTEVSIHLDNGYTVSRIKGKDNKYTITDPDKNVKDLTANGQNVPDEVKELLKFDYLNIADQADSYFIMFDSPGDIAKKINEIVDLSIGDKTLKALKSKTRSATSKIKVVKEDIDKLEEDLKEFSNLEEMSEKLKDLIILKDLANEHEETKHNVDRYHEQLSSIEVELNAIGNIDEQLKYISKLSDMLTAIKTLSDKKSLVVSYVQDLEYLSSELDKCKHAEEQLSQLSALIQQLNVITDKQKELETVKSKIEELTTLNKEITEDDSKEQLEMLADLHEKASEVDSLQNKVNDTTEKYKQLTELISEMQVASGEYQKALDLFNKAMDSLDVCLLCGRSD